MYKERLEAKLRRGPKGHLSMRQQETRVGPEYLHCLHQGVSGKKFIGVRDGTTGISLHQRD